MLRKKRRDGVLVLGVEWKKEGREGHKDKEGRNRRGRRRQGDKRRRGMEEERMGIRKERKRKA